MSLLRPDNRGARAIQAALSGEDPPADVISVTLYHYLAATEGADVNEDVVTAYEIYATPYRHVLDALLLIKTEDAQISAALGLSDTTLAAYKHLFMDVSVFKHVFAVRHFIQHIPPDSTQEFKSYDLAVTEGAEALLSRYRLGEAPELDPVALTSGMMREFASRAREHRNQPLNSKVAQNALRSAKNAVESAVALKGMQPKNGGQTAASLLDIALRNEPGVLTADQAPVPLGEIVMTGPSGKPPTG
jgi:hypothetical protein